MFAAGVLRTRRSILTYASGVVFCAATTLTALGATPLLLHWLRQPNVRALPNLGQIRFGAFRMITDWYGYLTMLDLGLGAALAPLVARALGKGDTEGLRRTLGAAIRAYLRLTAVTIGVGLAATPLIVWQVGVPPELRSDLRLAWMVGLLNFLPMGLAPFRALAEASQRGYRVNLLMTVECLLITAISLMLAHLGWGIQGQAWGFSLGILAFFAMLAWMGLHDYPGMLSSAIAAHRDPAIRRAIWNLGLPSFLIILGGRIGLLSDRIVAGGILGPAMAASLDVTVRVTNLAQLQLQGIGAASWAGLAELYAQGDIATFNQRLMELTKVVAVLGLAALGPIAAYNHQFFELWVGQKLVDFGGNTVTLVAAANALLLGLFSLWGWCFSGTGQVRRVLAPALAATVVNLGASLVLTHRLGLVGPVLGTFVAHLTVSLWWIPILIRQSFGVSLRGLFWSVGKPLLWGLPYAAGLWWFAQSHQVWGWFGLLAESGVAALGFLALSSFVVLSPTERALWRLRLAGLFP